VQQEARHCEVMWEHGHACAHHAAHRHALTELQSTAVGHAAAAMAMAGVGDDVVVCWQSCVHISRHEVRALPAPRALAPAFAAVRRRGLVMQGAGNDVAAPPWQLWGMLAPDVHAAQAAAERVGCEVT
jgi:hypothetical protein